MDYQEAARQLMQSFHQFHKRGHQKKIDAAMRGERFVVLYLLQKGNSVLPGAISSEMNISTARIATVLRSLEAKGLITRQIDQTDRRKILVNLTPKGLEEAKKQQEVTVKMIVNILKLLGAQDAKELVRIVDRLALLAPIISKGGSGPAASGTGGCP
jgi:DNA-binding MarR family transcriptional regulator